METLLAVVQEVELVGDGSWWDENAGSVFIAVAAIVAASLAAWIANRNHKRQLAHDRRMQGQDHTRELIDAASAAAQDADLLAHHYAHDTGGTAEEWYDLKNETVASINQLRRLSNRLRLRLGEDSPIAARHEQIHAEIRTVIAKIDEERGDNPDQPPTRIWTTAEKTEFWKDTEEAERLFREECFKWFNDSDERTLAERFRWRRRMWAKRLRKAP